eukprot:g1730.t1
MPGRFSSRVGSETCQICPTGWFQESEGEVSCDLADNGRVTLGGVIEIKVAKGWRRLCYDDGGCNDTERCSPGRYGTDPPDTDCLLCVAGKSSTAGSQLASSCKFCEQGKFAPVNGSAECLKCNVTEGKYSDVEGATSCKECELGLKSVLIACVDNSDERTMPAPSDVTIRMLKPASAALMTLNDAARGRGPKAGVNNWMSSVRVSWRISSKEWEKGDFTDFQVRVSLLSAPLSSKQQDGNETNDIRSRTVSKQEVQDRQGDAESETDATYSIVVDAIGGIPLFDRTFAIDVRTVDKGRGSLVGAWSKAPSRWLTTGAGKCSDPREYLDCTDSDPLAWECVPCPAGAYCENSITWRDVKANTSFWRDDRETNVTSALWVPPKFKFAKCPKFDACNGSAHNETCNEDLGYLNICNNDTGATCRLCNTCKPGWSMGSDGITCFPCAGPEEQASSFVFGVLVILFLFCVVGMLVFLKVKSSVRGDKEKNKAVHSTIKRILLSHLQVIALCMSLNVPWPKLLLDMMVLFSSVSSVSKHVSSLGCFYDTDAQSAGKNARFLYASAATVLVVPFFFALVTWVYWMFLVPTCAGRVLACGLRGSLTFSDPVPDVCWDLCNFFCGRRGSGDGGSSGSSGSRSRSHSSGSRASSPSLRTTTKKKRKKRKKKKKKKKRKGKKKGTKKGEKDIRKQHLRGNSQNVWQDAGAAKTTDVVDDENDNDDEGRNAQTLKTRDVWSYTNVLFMYMMYPSLCRIPFAVLSCRGIHPEVLADDRGDWAYIEFLRLDMEETCWQGQHAVMVALMATPGILLYALGTPLLAFVILYRHRSELEDKKYMFRLGLLYSGYLPNRWWYEGVVTLRKFFIIVAAAFLYDDALQLHLTLSVMIISYAVHHMLMPFVPETTVVRGSGGDDGDSDSDSDSNGDKQETLEQAKQRRTLSDRKTLHHLERTSIFICLAVVWSSTVFILYNDNKGLGTEGQCNMTSCNLLVIGVILANIVFVVAGISLFVVHFIKRNRALRELVVKANSSGLRKLLSVKSLTPTADKPVNLDPDTAGERRASMESPDVEIFINPIVLKQCAEGGGSGGGGSGRARKAWNKVRRQVFMPGGLRGEAKSTSRKEMEMVGRTGEAETDSSSDSDAGSSSDSSSDSDYSGSSSESGNSSSSSSDSDGLHNTTFFEAVFSP